MSEDSDAEKSHEPSQRKLDEARKRGDVPKSMELAAAAVYGAATLAGMMAGGGAIAQFTSASVAVIENADTLSHALVTAGSAPRLSLIAAFGLPVLPLLLFPLGGAVLAIMAQRGFAVSVERLQPKLSRIDPIAAMGRRFGRDGLFTFLKGLGKLIAVCAVIAALIPGRLPLVIESLDLGAGQSSGVMMQIAMQFLALSFVIALVFGGLDYGWQRLEFRRRNMMTRQEMVEEHKESEGDPHVKMQRRQRGRELALSQMIAEVAKADVVVVNPTHYAVALKWRRGDRNAPLCLAKGVDEVAARIREKAAEHGVPIHRDPPTARAIHATVEVGHPIRPEHYKAVAAAIRFAETMRKHARRPRG